MIRIVLAALAALTLYASQAAADDYPNRPIRVFTTSSAGGISDVFMRVLGDQLRASLGQPLIVENKPGAPAITARAPVPRRQRTATRSASSMPTR
jgi:tripartite-type tricarboxylate transporter receptor subunit TctC